MTIEIRICGDCGDVTELGNHLNDGTPACTSRDQANARRDRQDRPRVGHRALHEIGREIGRKWPEPYFGARPYIAAMRHLNGIGGMYGRDRADDIVRYFLVNAKNWRGDDARRIKAELKGMLA